MIERQGVALSVLSQAVVSDFERAGNYMKALGEMLADLSVRVDVLEQKGTKCPPTR